MVERKDEKKNVKPKQTLFTKEGEAAPVEFTIDKAVPMPVIKRRLKYPFDKLLEVGDSFGFDISLLPNVRNSASRYAKAKGIKFIVRADTEKTARCWRKE